MSECAFTVMSCHLLEKLQQGVPTVCWDCVIAAWSAALASVGELLTRFAKALAIWSELAPEFNRLTKSDAEEPCSRLRPESSNEK